MSAERPDNAPSKPTTSPAARRAIRMAAFDLDGTLLDTARRLPEANVRAIRRAAAGGMRICLASGRPLASVRPFARAVGCGPAIISYNGARVDMSVEGKCLYIRPVAREVVRTVLYAAGRVGLHVNVYTGDGFVVQQDSDYAREYSRVFGVPYWVDPDLADRVGESAVKLLAICEPDEVERRFAFLAELLGPSARLVISAPRHIEIVHPSVTKATALGLLCQHVGIALDEVAAFGDADNDVEMLKAAGVAVAMANGSELAKQAASVVAPHCDQAGAATVLESLLHPQ